MRTIRTAFLTLEPQTITHAEQMFVVLSDPAIYAFENEPPPSLEWLRARFAKLESRQSPDGQAQWLNWVVRLPTSELIGFVQATVHLNGFADIAYVFASAHWGRGLAREAVEAMIAELIAHYPVRALSAVLKRDNVRSLKLLDHLGFSLASPAEHVEHQVAIDELLMHLHLQLSVVAPFSS